MPVLRLVKSIMRVRVLCAARVSALALVQFLFLGIIILSVQHWIGPGMLISAVAAGEVAWMKEDAQTLRLQKGFFTRVTVENRSDNDFEFLVQLTSTDSNSGRTKFEKNGHRILVVPGLVKLRAASRQVFHIQWVGSILPAQDQTYEIVLGQLDQLDVGARTVETQELKLPITVPSKNPKG